MKYQKPKLYKLFPSRFNEAICGDGNAASASSCISGPDASSGCRSGAAASTTCQDGSAAASNCITGDGYEDEEEDNDDENE